MAGHGEKRSRKAEALIAALLTEPTAAKAAAAAGVSERTARAWLADPDFRAKYRAARRQVVEQAVGRLQSLTDRAVAALDRGLDADRDGDRIRAAVAVFDRALRGVELLDVLERVEHIEEHLKDKGDRP